MKIKLAMCLSVLAIVSCGRNSSESEGPQQEKANETVPTSVFKDMLVTGSWKNSCTDEKNASYQRVKTFGEDGVLEDKMIRYFATGCRAGDEKIVYSQVFHNSRELTPSDLKDFKTIRAEMKSYTATIKCCVVNSMNTNKNYGYSDWKLNETKDISGRKYSDEDEATDQVNSSWRYTFRKDDDSNLTIAPYKDHLPVYDNAAAHKYKKIP